MSPSPRDAASDHKPIGQARAICREGEERLPRSATGRSRLTWIKLLSRVDPRAQDGFGFEGQVFRPGDTVPVADLPEPAIFLEYAGAIGNHEDLWILWRYDITRREFRDLAQVRARGPEWAAALRPIAIRELNPQSQPDRIAQFDYIGARDRVLALMDAELEGAPGGARRRLCALIHDSLLAGIAKSA
jgi:hypothetical protein